MKVLLIVTRAGIGGAQRSVLELARELSARGHQVTIGAGERGWLFEEASRLGVSLREFRWLRRSSNPLFAILFAYELWSFLGMSKEPGVVHLNSSNPLPGALAAKLRKMRVVFTARGLSTLDEGYETSLLLRALYWSWFKLWFLFVDRVVCVSTRNAERLKKLRLGGSKVVVIPNGLNPANLSFLERGEARTRLGAYDTDVVVLALGRLEYAKNQQLLIEAWPQVIAAQPHARLVLVGDGPDESKLKKLAANKHLGDRVHFAGAFAFGSRLIPGADIVALPSRYEGWPVALLEALFAGAAIVAADVGGVTEQIGDAGVVIPRESAPAVWAEAITNLVGDPARRTELIAKAKERSALWTADRMIDTYEAVYRG